MIHELLRGAPGPGGTVQLVCGKCVAVAQDAFTENSRVLKVCSKCGAPLGEWATVAERDAELAVFVEEIKRRLNQRPAT